MHQSTGVRLSLRAQATKCDIHLGPRSLPFALPQRLPAATLWSTLLERPRGQNTEVPVHQQQGQEACELSGSLGCRFCLSSLWRLDVAWEEPS